MRALPSFGDDAAPEVQERATSWELSPDNWFVAARSDQLKKAPLSRTIRQPSASRSHSSV